MNSDGCATDENGFLDDSMTSHYIETISVTLLAYVNFKKSYSIDSDHET